MREEVGALGLLGAILHEKKERSLLYQIIKYKDYV